MNWTRFRYGTPPPLPMTFDEARAVLRRAFLRDMHERFLRDIAVSQELRHYLRAISPDLPLHREATGWWVFRDRVANTRDWLTRARYRWQPFGGVA